jgi:hypothetical protein
MFELIFNNIYLPNFENQKDFNRDMLELLDRVEERISKIRSLSNPVIFAPIS